MAGKQQANTLPSSVWPSSVIPPPPTAFAITQILGFFDDLGYDKTAKALRKEAASNGVVLDSPEVESLRGPFKKSLGEIYADALLQEDDSSSSQESSSDESESEDDSTSSADESSGSDSEDSVAAMAAIHGVKRKRSDSPDSDSSSEASESDSDSSSDDEATPAAKKSKLDAQDSSDDEATSVSSSEVSSSSDSDSSSESESSSDSDSSSDDEKVPAVKQPSAKTSVAKKVGVKTSTTKKVSEKTPKVTDDESEASSATVVAEPVPEDNGGMHPSRASRMDPGANVAVKTPKTSNVPFSRIPKDTVVDPRFASNAYVSYDYADRAHQDLIVTKGKGFTKEKNKKKRGSYRGGVIDTTPKGIKFDD